MWATHLITTKLSSSIVLVMVITWFDFGKVLLETVILAKFLLNFGCIFSRSNTILVICQEWLVRLMWNEREMHWLDTGYNMWPWHLALLMPLTLDVSRSNFERAVSQDVGLIDVKWKESKLIGCWADNMTLTFDHTHDLDLGVSRWEAEITLF